MSTRDEGEINFFRVVDLRGKKIFPVTKLQRIGEGTFYLAEELGGAPKREAVEEEEWFKGGKAEAKGEKEEATIRREEKQRKRGGRTFVEPEVSCREGKTNPQERGPPEKRNPSF